eukprot:scaffold16457_cov109-Isochrysis_galbana.AAC.6
MMRKREMHWMHCCGLSDVSSSMRNSSGEDSMAAAGGETWPCRDCAHSRPAPPGATHLREQFRVQTREAPERAAWQTQASAAPPWGWAEAQHRHKQHDCRRSAARQGTASRRQPAGHRARARSWP